MRAILRTGCRWYCRGRWWADRLQLHPGFAAGLQALEPAFRGLPHSPLLHQRWKAHVGSVGLPLAGYAWSGAALLAAWWAPPPLDSRCDRKFS